MKKIFITTALLLSAIIVEGQGQPGIDDGSFNQVNNSLRNVFYVFTSTGYYIAAIIGIVGALRVYRKWTLGEPIIKEASNWFFACLFYVVANAFLRGVLGL